MTDVSDVAYDRFIAEIYDSSPFFGQGRTRELERFIAPYFRHLAGQTERILEFGSGTGNLTVPLARAGYKIDSVDISPYMHGVLARKLEVEPVHVVQNTNQLVADAITFTGREPYHCIVMPEGILIALPNEELQMALLKSCHRNLAAGGRVYFDFFQPFYRTFLHESATEYSRFRTPDGRVYLLTIEFTTNRYTQVQHWKVKFTRVEKDELCENVVVDLDFRHIYYSECKLMLQLAGFRVVEFDVEYVDRSGFFVVAEKI